MAVSPPHFLVVGAGAAGLMAGAELAHAGRRVTILEARQRCGGRIWALPETEFGYPAEGGAEFVHGPAPLTRALMRAAGLRLAPRRGSRWTARAGKFVQDEPGFPHAGRFYRALEAVQTDLPIAEFLDRHFADRSYEGLRRAVTRRVEGYDAADPGRASTLAIREEWMDRRSGQGGQIAEGYGALVAHLAAACRRDGGVIELGAAVAALEAGGGRIAAHCSSGAVFEADAAILTVPPPLLREIALPPSARGRAAAAADIGFGNVVKILLRFASKWWAEAAGRDLGDLSFLFSGAAVPTWWTQHPAQHPVLTGWYAGPKADRVAHLDEPKLVEMGLASLAESFDLPPERLRQNLVAARAIDWGTDPFARGAYSYATPETRAALSVLKRREGDGIFFAGEALYAGPDMGTVEAALASAHEAVQAIRAEAS